MRFIRKKWIKDSLSNNEYYIDNPKKNIGRWREVFGNDNPIHLEFDCEEGMFISNMARYNPNINFLAVSDNEFMLAWTMKNVDSVFDGKIPSNLKLLKYHSKDIDQIFNFVDTIDRIYINFPAPYDKPKEHKNRLTYPKQLYKYRSFLRPGGDIFLKTDSTELYLDSIGYFREANFEIMSCTENLDRDNIFRRDNLNIYEKISSLQGVEIKGIIAKSNKL